jgi:hypothetical protein
MLRYVTTKWICTVVVINAEGSWLFDFVDGVESGRDCHLTIPPYVEAL